LEAPADLVVAQVAVSEVRAADPVVRAALEVRAVPVFITHLLHHQDIIILSDIMMTVRQDVRAAVLHYCLP
jgi:hypothetical protein